MRLAFFLRHRRRLLMQFDSQKRLSPVGISSSPSLKRPYTSDSPTNPPVEASGSLLSRISQDSPQPHAKMPRIDQSESTRPAGSSSRSAGQQGHKPFKSSGLSGSRSKASGSSKGSSRSGRGPYKGSAQSFPSSQSLPSFPQPDSPIHDEAYIRATYLAKDMKQSLEGNPKSPLSNYRLVSKGAAPSYQTEAVLLNGKMGYRSTVQAEEDPLVIGIGDASSRKEAERLAALSAIYQLHAHGLLEDPLRKKHSAPEPSTLTSSGPPTISDGSAVTYEQARQFMDYYCRRYGFGKPDLTYNETSQGPRGRTKAWEAILNVGGRRIGIGAGASKKVAQTACYLDVTQYLESCDPELWKSFLQAASKGKDLGLAPRVQFQMSDILEEDIRDLCNDIRNSTLYQNRPKSVAPASHAPAASDKLWERRAVSPEYLAVKSERLLLHKERYDLNPQMETMRNTRKALPVYSCAEDALAHIRENEVTICMAATGSGKTTQIPQLILDEYIRRGEGAMCNIICTQPRRLAAISVATRVAKERNEVVGKGSIGYSVRFDYNPPEEHGSVMFCTTGVFLKRMQTALSVDGVSGSGTLDDVTHVLVDEVHERDVDTDLLLVVLKRLLADRKVRGKPLKVVLMSATINPILFQTYFADTDGKEAGVVDIPGRSFPVDKHFMDDFVPALASNPSNRWVFQEDSVMKYVRQELGASALPGPAGRQVPSSGPESDRLGDSDLELPYPLIALAISHVLQKTSDGHVLVFLPGWDEIMAVNRILQDRPLGLPFKDSSKFSIHLLHSTIPVAEQQVIFDPPPEGVRRIILSTNIAETSVTIPDVVYVIDAGKIKEQRYDPQRHMSSLVSAWVGSSNLNQRAGRAGRHRSGEYFGIMSRRRADELPPHQTVEMKRVDLTNVVMHVKALNFPGMSVEEVLASAIEPPAAERVSAAMNDLQMVGAIDEHQTLTSLGRVLLQLPVDVQVGRLVLFGCFFRCLDQALTIAALISNRDPFVSPMHLKQEASQVKNSWTPQEFRSDTLAALQAYNAWWAMQSRGEYVSANRFLSDNFLSKSTLLLVDKIKGHILSALKNCGVLEVSAGGRAEYQARGRGLFVPHELNENGESLPLLAALIAVASQPNFAIRTGEKTYRTQMDKATFIHPSSVNHRKREIRDDSPMVEKQIIAFAEKRQNISVAGANINAQMSLMTTTRLDPMTYVLFGAYRIEVTERGLECDDWLPIVGNIYALDDLQRLKTMLEGCMARVYEGIVNKRRQTRAPTPVAPREEEESGDEEPSDTKDHSLTSLEVKQLDLLTRDIVRILNRYADERMASQSRSNSRPATPMGSPSYGTSRLPPSGPRSGQSTPLGMRSAFSSRPGTPSRLSRAF